MKFLFLILFFLCNLQIKAGIDPNLELDNLSKMLETAVNINRQGDYNKAMTISNEVIQKANKSNFYGLTAKATSLQAKILYAQKSSKAKSKFELSNSILFKHGLTDKSLMIENYSYLKLIANINGDAKLAKEIEDNLSRLNGKQVKTIPIAKAPEAIVVSELEKEKAAKLKLMSEQEKLQTLTKEMQEELKLSASKLDELSEDQLKSKLIMDAQESQLMNVRYTDSLNNERLKLQELSLSEANSKRNLFATGFAFMLLLLGGSLYLFYKSKKTSKLLEEKNFLIEIEREKSESLLRNILPVNIVEELKEHGFSKAQNYDEVCVGFLDFVSFSKISEKYNPQTVLDDLNTCFKAFDEVISKYELEKIKTIGDCYMYAGGLSESSEGDTIDKMVRASKDMVIWLIEWNKTRTKKMLITYDARVGLHSGPVAAGVVGTKKFLYDIWGDTVNIAARMEQNSAPNRINISELVYHSIKDNHTCEYRGEIEAKNKGLLKMYFVS
jgi:adenylate cyclase